MRSAAGCLHDVVLEERKKYRRRKEIRQCSDAGREQERAGQPEDLAETDAAQLMAPGCHPSGSSAGRQHQS